MCLENPKLCWPQLYVFDVDNMYILLPGYSFWIFFSNEPTQLHNFLFLFGFRISWLTWAWADQCHLLRIQTRGLVTFCHNILTCSRIDVIFQGCLGARCPCYENRVWKQKIPCESISWDSVNMDYSYGSDSSWDCWGGMNASAYGC